jgi:hypothetical protein
MMFICTCGLCYMLYVYYMYMSVCENVTCCTCEISAGVEVEFEYYWYLWIPNLITKEKILRLTNKLALTFGNGDACRTMFLLIVSPVQHCLMIVT